MHYAESPFTIPHSLFHFLTNNIIMGFPLKQQVLNNIMAERDLTDVSRTTIRQCAAIAAEMEKAAGEKFLRLEVGVPGLAPGQVGV